MSTKEKAARECGLEEAISTRKNNPTGLIGYRQRKGLTAYEELRLQWLELHPMHSDSELAAACVVMARHCGLILLNQLKGVHRYGTES